MGTLDTPLALNFQDETLVVGVAFFVALLALSRLGSLLRSERSLSLVSLQALSYKRTDSMDARTAKGTGCLARTASRVLAPTCSALTCSRRAPAPSLFRKPLYIHVHLHMCVWTDCVYA